MRASRAPLLVFSAAFLTFLLAFGTLLVLVGPQLKEKMKAREAADSTPAPATTATTAEPSEEGIRGTVVGPDDRPVAGAEVLVCAEAADGSGLEVLDSATSGEDGTFFTTLPQRPLFSVMVKSGDYPRLLCRGLSPPPARFIGLGKLKLVRGKPLRVSIYDALKHPISGALVEAVDASTLPDPLKRPVIAKTTDKNGQADLHALDFGSIALRVTHPDFSRWETTITPTLGQFENGLDVSVPLARPVAYIDGDAINSLGRPLDRGTVYARDLDGVTSSTFEATIQKNGAFRLGPMPEGRYGLRAECDGSLTAGERTALTGNKGVRLTLESAGQIRARILSSRPLKSKPELILSIRDSQGLLLPYTGELRLSFEGDHSAFRIDGVPPGVYQVRAAAEGFVAGRTTDVEIHADHLQVQVEIQLTQGGELEAVLTDGRGRKVQEASVAAYEGTKAPAPALAALLPETTHRQTSSNYEGYFQLQKLSPGPQVLILEAKGYPTRQIGPICIMAGETVRLGRLALAGGGSVSGMVRRSDGSPAPGAVVLIRSSTDDTWLPLIADSDGSYSLRGLEAGTYLLEPVIVTLDGAVAQGERRAITVEWSQHSRLDIAFNTP